MAHTSEQRDHLRTALCGAMTKRGVRCRAFAGQGTDHLGVGRCKYHGGSTQNHRKKADREIVAAEMATLGTPIDVTPDQVAMGLLRQGAGMVAALTARLETLGELDPAVMSVFNSERDRLARFAKVASEMGIEERKVKAAEKRTDLMARFLEGVLDRIELTADQRSQVGPAIRAEIAALNGSAVETTPA
jgi:hypothetical protein